MFGSKLGKKAHDKVTGFEGVIVGRAEYLTGCTQFCLQPPAKDGEFKNSQWFDEGRVEIDGPGISVKAVSAAANGGPNRDVPTK